MDDDIPDLRPGPWRAHGWILGALATLYLVLASSAWPRPAPVPTGKLAQGLSVLVAIGEGAAMAAIILGGAAVLLYAAISTAILGIARLRSALELHAILIGLIVIAALIASRA